MMKKKYSFVGIYQIIGGNDFIFFRHQTGFVVLGFQFSNKEIKYFFFMYFKGKSYPQMSKITKAKGTISMEGQHNQYLLLCLL